MSIAEFRDAGFLQEVNRRFLHPLGLALEIELDEHGQAIALAGIWDYRDDPQGIIYDHGIIDAGKALRVETLRRDKAVTRQEQLGFVIQPIEDPHRG